MDIEAFITGSKWNILKKLANAKKAPIDLAKETRTTIANTSQQLRLLETARIITVEKILGRQKTQPRMLYSIPEPQAFIALISPHFVEKKMFQPDRLETFVLKSLFVRDDDVRKELLKLTPIVSENAKLKISVKNDKIFISTNDKKVKQLVNALQCKNIVFEKPEQPDLELTN